MSNNFPKFRIQRGGALIIFLLVLVLAGTAALFPALDSGGLKIKRDKNTAATLAEAKTALIGVSVKAISGGTRPGNLIRPDMLSENPADYDGTAESGCLDKTKVAGLPLISSGINMICLGRLPWKELGVSVHSPSEPDSGGIMPWYAVSANLVDPICLAVLNSNILNLVNTSPTLDCSGATLPYPWLTVRDSSGNIVSDRVAAIILIPGVVRGIQSRSNNTLSGANQYLDTLVVPAGCSLPCVVGTYSNADMDNDFIMAAENEPLALENSFNDQLIYITIEELMAVVEKRVVQEAGSGLRSYYLTSNATPSNRFYPYAAALGSVDNACVENNLNGFLPLLSPASSCISSSNCSSSFAKTPVVSFTHFCSGDYTEGSGACTFSGKQCTCTGAGQCTRNPLSTNNSCGGTTRLRKFTCDASGNCTSNVFGEYTFTYVAPSPDNTFSTANCITLTGSSTITCSGAGSFSITNCTHPNKILTGLQNWFVDNHWQDFVYYAISNDCNYAVKGCVAGNLIVGTQANKYALVISSGRQLTSQSRPSNQIQDYLDKSDASPYGVTLFDAIGTPRTQTYNDQMFIVAP